MEIRRQHNREKPKEALMTQNSAGLDTLVPTHMSATKKGFRRDQTLSYFSLATLTILLELILVEVPSIIVSVNAYLEKP